MTCEALATTSSIRVQEATESPFDIWEERLAAEGMPAELLQETMLTDVECSLPPRESAETTALRKILGYEAIDALLAKVSPRESFVVSAHIGRYYDIPLDYKDISDLLGLEVKRTRQVHHNAINELRKDKHAQLVRDLEYPTN